MDEQQPSTSKSTRSESPQLPSELDISSEEFDALQALYADPKVKLTKRKSKIIYQNMAQFEIDYKNKGLYGLSIKSTEKNLPKKSKSVKEPEDPMSGRRFLPHQMAIQTTGVKMKNKRTLLKQIAEIQGPLSLLRDCMMEKRKISVHTRSEHGVRGTITGYVISFDKHWNLLLRDVHETWKRRKYKYDENKFCGTPTDCSERLRDLGITLPIAKVKSLNRKNVELSRSIPLLFMRGEQVVLVRVEKSGEGVDSTKMACEKIQMKAK